MAGAEAHRASVLDLVDALVDKSLLQSVDEAGAEPRVTMLETIREFGLELLEEREEAGRIGRRHAEWCVWLVEHALPELSGPEQALWLNRLEVDHDNLRAALTWAIGHGEAETAMRIAAAAWRFWEVRGYLNEGRGWLERVAALPGVVSPAVRSKVLNNLANLTYDVGDYARARELYEESLAISHQTANRRDIADTLYNLALLARVTGEYQRSHALHEKSLAIREELGEPFRLSLSYNNFGDVFNDQGDFTMARSLYEKALSIREAIGDDRGIAYVLVNLGKVAENQGDLAAARAWLDRALAHFTAVGEKIGIASAFHHLGSVERRDGNFSAAVGRFAEALAIRRNLGDRRGLAESLEGMAGVFAAQGDAARACRLLGAAEALREALSAPRSPVTRSAYDADVRAAKARLGPAAAQLAWEEGRQLTVEAAVADALAAPAFVSTAMASSRERNAFPLTPRELEVLRHLAAGHTDRESGDLLSISPRTVERHINNILDKLDLPSRTALVAFAVRNGLA